MVQLKPGQRLESAVHKIVLIAVVHTASTEGRNAAVVLKQRWDCLQRLLP